MAKDKPACVLCESNKTKIICNLGEEKLHKCNNCKLVFRWPIPEKDIVLLPIESNTTELIAYYIHSRLKNKIKGKIKVKVTEKENYSAEFVG